MKFPQKLKNNLTYHSEFTLGTAQLGLPYGRANVTGMLDEEKAQELMRLALDYGVSSIDTARAYGFAEERIGKYLQTLPNTEISIITKLDPLSDLDNIVSSNEKILRVENSVFQSCDKLGVNRLNTLLLHRWSHYHDFNGLIWKRLLKFKNENIIKYLGASVYSPEEAIVALLDENITHLQIPFNILDWRWLSNTSFIDLVKKRHDVVIHIRSAFLQGLLVKEITNWPAIEDNQKNILSLLDHFVEKFDRKNKADLCYAYVRSFPWVTSIVGGVDNIAQLKENVELFQHSPLDKDQLLYIHQELPKVSEKLLNPHLW